MPGVLNANVVFLPMVYCVLVRTTSGESKHCKVAGSKTFTMTSASWGKTVGNSPVLFSS